MPSGLVALLDDVSLIARAAASSLDDVGVAATKAGSKAAGVVIDDAAVTPRYVTGFSAKRELPIVGKIALATFSSSKERGSMSIDSTLASCPCAACGTTNSKTFSVPS